MPNLAAARKSVRKDKKRRAHNLDVVSELKTVIKKLRALLSAKKQQEAKDLLSIVMSRLDKAAKKGIIKPNNASRKKALFSSQVAKLKA